MGQSVGRLGSVPGRPQPSDRGDQTALEVWFGPPTRNRAFFIGRCHPSFTCHREYLNPAAVATWPEGQG